MARQKAGADQVHRNVLEVQPEPEETKDDDSPLSSRDEKSEFDSETDEEEWVDVTHEEAFKLGDAAEKDSDLDRAVQCFQQAIRKYVARGNEEVSAGAADYWLAYGHALLKIEEDSTDLFHPESAPQAGEVDDDKQIAWESLDIARLCFTKRLDLLEETGKLVRTPLASVWDFIVSCPEAGQPPYKTRSIDPDLMKSVRNSIFTRLRLGDFCQSHHQFEEAIQEFSSALALCVELGAPPNEALQAAVPLAHCLMATDHEHTEAAFKLALRLIDYELSLPETKMERKSILMELKPDLAAQMQDYLHERAQIKEEAMKVIESIGFGEAMDVEGDAPVDLGRMGKRRKKDSDAQDKR